MKKRAMYLVIALFSTVLTIQAESVRVAIPQLSPATIEIYKKLATAVVAATGNVAEIQVMPFSRCILSLERKEIDIVAVTVAIPDAKKWKALSYDYSSAEAFKIVFVMYGNKAKKINVAQIKKGKTNGLKLETDGAHLDHFDFATSPSTSFEASLRKVDSGAIDGFVFAQPSSDGVIKSLGLKNISRQYFDTFSAKFLLQKGARGDKFDSLITDGLAKIKATGQYDEIMETYIAGASNYEDWQP